MRIDPVRPASREKRWMLNVSDEEFHDLHHALRMLLKSWLPPKGEEAERVTRSADELWDAHCNRTAASNTGKEPLDEGCDTNPITDWGHE